MAGESKDYDKMELIHFDEDMYRKVTEFRLNTFDYLRERIPSVKESHDVFQVNHTLSSLTTLMSEYEGIFLKIIDESSGETYLNKCFDNSRLDEWMMDYYDEKRSYIAEAVGIPELKVKVAGRIFSDGKDYLQGLIVKQFRLDDAIDMTHENPSLEHWNPVDGSSPALDDHIESMLKKAYNKKHGVFDFVLAVSNDDEKKEGVMAPYTASVYPFYKIDE